MNRIRIILGLGLVISNLAYSQSGSRHSIDSKFLAHKAFELSGQIKITERTIIEIDSLKEELVIANENYSDYLSGKHLRNESNTECDCQGNDVIKQMEEEKLKINLLNQKLSELGDSQKLTDEHEKLMEEYLNVKGELDSRGKTELLHLEISSAKDQIAGDLKLLEKFKTHREINNIVTEVVGTITAILLVPALGGYLQGGPKEGVLLVAGVAIFAFEVGYFFYTNSNYWKKIKDLKRDLELRQLRLEASEELLSGL